MNRSLGQWGEDYAASYLEDEGWEIKYRNYNTPFGECDLIAEKDNLTAIVEVKTRQDTRFGPPEMAVTSEKRDHLRKAARFYRSHTNDTSQLRFDVLAIKFNKKDPELQHIEGAFQGQE